MDYSMLERPKLYNAKSLKFYPEEYDRPQNVAFRHKNYSPDLNLDLRNYNLKKPYKTDLTSIKPHASYERRCPIYVHPLSKVLREEIEGLKKNEGDFVSKNSKQQTTTRKVSVMNKLEETYWANWKPSKIQHYSPRFRRDKEITVIKDVAPKCHHRIRIYPDPSPTKQVIVPPNTVIERKSQEIQTDDLMSVEVESESNIEAKQLEEDTVKDSEECGSKFLKHTDSFILNSKKQQGEKERFEQPKCIRLYKKPSVRTSRNYVRGGSYPLKSCLKQESSFLKTGNIRLGRPGSPVIVSSTYSSKFSRGYRK